MSNIYASTTSRRELPLRIFLHSLLYDYILNILSYHPFYQKKTFSLFCDRIFLPFFKSTDWWSSLFLQVSSSFWHQKKVFFLYNKQRRNKSLKKITAIKIVFYLYTSASLKWNDFLSSPCWMIILKLFFMLYDFKKNCFYDATTSFHKTFATPRSWFLSFVCDLTTSGNNCKEKVLIAPRKKRRNWERGRDTGEWESIG